MPSNITYSLDNCEDEPIHTPGTIQSHGYLIALKLPEFTIQTLSKNITELIHHSPDELLNAPFEKLNALFDQDTALIRDVINSHNFNQEHFSSNPYPISVDGRNFDLILSQAEEDTVLLELESAPEEQTEDAMQQLLGKSILRINQGDSLSEMLQAMTEQIHEATGYDRIMVYKFWEDWHGEVVAEVKPDEMDPLLGLHYPATDIPEQARELYKKNLTRIITDVHSEPVPLLSHRKDRLNLTHSSLRAVSPIHIQYLKNMEVGASFSISLIYKGELWGLIACHNAEAKVLSYNTRKTCRLISQLLSNALEHHDEHESIVIQQKFEAAVDDLHHQLQQTWDIEAALTDHETGLCDVNEAAGAALFFNNRIQATGKTPNIEELKKIRDWLSRERPRKLFETSCLSNHIEGAEKYADIASGMLAGVISNELGEYIVWFKPERVRTINWAGNPEDFARSARTLNPRKSFEEWIETVQKRSEAWTNLEKSVSEKVLDEVVYIINRKADEVRTLNAELKHAYEELDTFSYTISHDLKSPLSAMRLYVDYLMRDRSNLDDKQYQQLDKINREISKMTRMIKDILEYSRIRDVVKDKEPVLVEGLIEDLESRYKASYPDKKVVISSENGFLPVSGNKTMVSQVFSNLIDNAIKYSRTNLARVDIGSEDRDTEIRYTISDSGYGIEEEEIKNIFNLFYRVKSNRTIDGSGVGLAIVKRIMNKHNGRIWVESQPNEGTTFFLTFPKN